MCLPVPLPWVSCDEWQLVESNLQSEINTIALQVVKTKQFTAIKDELIHCVSDLRPCLREQRITCELFIYAIHPMTILELKKCLGGKFNCLQSATVRKAAG